MTDGANPHNGTVQRADFKLIHLAPRQSYHITTKELINNKAKKGYLTRSATTRSLQKELGNPRNNRDIIRMKNDNSEDKILFIINGFKK